MTGREIQRVYRFWYAVMLADGSVWRFGSDEPVFFEALGLVNYASYRFYSLEENKTFFYARREDGYVGESDFYWQKTLSGRVLEDENDNV